MGQDDRRHRRPAPGTDRQGSARSSTPDRLCPDEGPVRGGGRSAGPTPHPRSAVRPLSHGLLRRLQFHQDTRQRAQPGLARGLPAPRLSPDRVDDAGRDRNPLGDRRGVRPHRGRRDAYATRLLHHLGPSMLVLWDRGFDGNDFLAAVHATGARIVGRINQRRRPPIGKALTDSSYLSAIGGVPVRVIEAQISIACSDGTDFAGSYRLVTTLLDARRYPADRLVRLYHERWEHESAYYALRHTVLDGRVLRSGDPVGVEQEMWALLVLYQLLRRAMVEAAESRPGTDPDRCGFTIAYQTARDLLIRAEGVLEQGMGAIGRRVLSALLPARRPRVSTRKVKSPISRYAERKLDGRPDTSQTVASVTITLLPPPPPHPELPATTVPQYVGPGKTSNRMARVLTMLQQEPERHWQAREIAELLGDVTLVTTYRQLTRWAEKGLIKKIRRGRYTAAATPAAPTLHPGRNP
ncbi:transposase [Kitasatospora cathayae]|uniref:Transposase n=2 Tax=Kitasatospora cathayae TaxID=3004092 RepID=A0ABY7QF29_9ACTN|nr:transposase [Kitasatospora sp. HUAS 3-15]WBP91352.1 transposase [Kitasatospora sp. HUAS 3-15]